jgi:hypothetical protein
LPDRLDLGQNNTTEMLGTLEFDDWGYLPDGEHHATWSEIVARFGQGARRGWLIEGLLMLLIDLRRANVVDAWLDGSFVTEVHEPSDYDVCWSPLGADTSLLPREFGYGQAKSIDESLSNYELLVRKYRGDAFVHIPPWADFVSEFRTDREDRTRGIIKIDMDSLP